VKAIVLDKNTVSVLYFYKMRILKNKAFSRFARKEGITDDELKAIIPQLEAKQPDADLGGDVYKMRVARPGEGKSGGYRVFVYFRSGERTFFAHGFAKSDAANIKDDDLAFMKRTAKNLLSMAETELEAMLKNGQLIEITGV
jgi:hypothetical protein